MTLALPMRALLIMSFFDHFIIFLQEGKPPLWFAALDGRSDIALLLLQYHAEVDLPCAVRYSIISLEDVLPLKFYAHDLHTALGMAVYCAFNVPDKKTIRYTCRPYYINFSCTFGPCGSSFITT